MVDLDPFLDQFQPLIAEKKGVIVVDEGGGFLAAQSIRPLENLNGIAGMNQSQEAEKREMRVTNGRPSSTMDGLQEVLKAAGDTPGT